MTDKERKEWGSGIATKSKKGQGKAGQAEKKRYHRKFSDAQFPKACVLEGRRIAEQSPSSGAGELARIAAAIKMGGSAARRDEISRLLCIRDRDGSVRKFQANEVQEIFDERFRQKNIVLKARQMGITTWVSARFFLDVITQPGTLAVQVAHDASAAEQIFQIVHRFYRHLPQGMREGRLRTSRANRRQLVFREIESEFRVETASDLDAGRGLTIQRLHASEVGRWRNADEVLASLRAAVAPGGEIVLESTPQGTYGAFYREWKGAEQAGYVQHFFPWWMEPSHRSDAPVTDLTDDERFLQAQHGLTLEQIAYRRELQITHKKFTQQEFAEDAESCFLAFGDCIFDVKAIDDQLLRLTNCDERQAVWEFMPALSGKRYVIGVDACAGVKDGDFACAQVIDERGMQCAELFARISPEELAKEVEMLAWKYGNAVVAVERNANGREVITHLRKTDVPLYQDDDDADGFETNKKTRPELVAKLVEFAAEHMACFQSRRLLQQMRSFIRKYNGRAEAASGEYDDAVMAMGIALYVRERMSQDQKRKRMN